MADFAAQFFVPGLPKAQPRTKPTKRGKRGKSGVYNPPTADAWKRAVVMAGKKHRPAKPLKGGVLVTLEFIFPRPKRLLKVRPDERLPYIAKPDRDNLDKAVLDALSPVRRKGVVIEQGWWKDDAQVYGGSGPWKFYGRVGEPIGVHVILTAQTEDDTRA